jgi:flavin-dependent dehydrogenase
MIRSASSAARAGHDVIVVGAGPAGSTAAWKLARAGAKVLLIDACEFPRSKPCGEALSPGATPLLEEMGLLPRLRREGATEVGRWRLRTPDGRFIAATFGSAAGSLAAPDVGIALSRRRLDAVLLEAAIAAGAEFRAPLRVFEVRERSAEREAVRLLARDGSGRELDLRAPWVIGADGLRSVVARRVTGIRRGARDRLAVVGRYRPEAGDGRDGSGLDRRTGELRLSAAGCLGAAPIEHGLWTVGVVVSLRRAPELSTDPFAFFRATVDGYGFPPPASEAVLHGGLEVTGPFEVAPRRVTAPGVVLTGDAAGYFDPFTGQGVYRALLTGRLAATAVLTALADPRGAAEARRAYADALDDCLVAGRRVQKLVDAVVNRPALMNPAGRLMARRPGLLSLLLDVTGDRVPAGRLLRPSVLAAAWRGG